MSKTKKSKKFAWLISITGFLIAFFFTGVAFTENEYWILLYSLVGIIMIYAGFVDYKEMKINPIARHLIDNLLGLVMLGILILVGVGIFETGPYSLYFIGISVLFLFITYMFNLRINKIIDGKSNKEGMLIYFLYYFKKSLRVFFLALIPIVIFQIILDHPYDHDIREYMPKIEELYIKISQITKSYHITEILIGVLFFVFIVGPFIAYKSSTGKQIIEKIGGSLITLNILVFIFSFSLFTSVHLNKAEATWRFDIRENIVSSEKYLRKDIEEYWVLSQLNINKEIQNEINRVLAAVIATASSYEVVSRLYTTAWHNKVNDETVIKVQLSQELQNNLPLYKLSSINSLFQEGYNPKNVREALALIRRKSSEISSFKRASIDSLSQSLSVSVSLLIPDLPNEVVKQIVADVIDTSSEFKIKMELEDRAAKIPTLVLATHLLVTEPKVSSTNTEEFATKYESRLKSINSDYLSDIYSNVYNEHLASQQWLEEFRKGMVEAKYKSSFDSGSGLEKVLRRLSR